MVPRIPRSGVPLALTAGVLVVATAAVACAAPSATPTAPTCRTIDHGYWPAGTGEPAMETVVTGLEVPWGLAVLPAGNLLVSERSGRLRLVRGGALVAERPARPAQLGGIDWLPDGRIVVANHGPSGEMGLRGHDQVFVARAGDNLGWPVVYGCGAHAGMVAPVLVWHDALPPGGLLVYRGPRPWSGSVLVASLGARQLQRTRSTRAPPGPWRTNRPSQVMRPTGMAGCAPWCRVRTGRCT